jgi:hypothetical protein
VKTVIYFMQYSLSHLTSPFTRRKKEFSMKNTNKVSKIQASKMPVFGLAVIAAIALTLALTSCDIPNEEDGVFTSWDAFQEWLEKQPENTPDTPYRVKLNYKELWTFRLSKYVYLDFSGSTFTNIWSQAFKSETKLVGITIPNSVTSIGDGAFAGCTGLTSVTIPNSVTTIGEWAFLDCTSLTSVTIPNSVTTIGENAFQSCTSLASITIPSSVTTIEEWAFYNCTSLTSVTIPNSVTTIGGNAFKSCTSLASITIPNSVTSIGYSAFQQCTSLTSVTFEGTIPSSSFKTPIWEEPAFPGDLIDKFYATDPDNGTPGTYKTTAPVDKYSSVWTKQQ